MYDNGLLQITVSPTFSAQLAELIYYIAHPVKSCLSVFVWVPDLVYIFCLITRCVLRRPIRQG